MLREHGPNAAIEASNNASAQNERGNEQAAAKWRRVMVLIAEKSQQAELGVERDKHSKPPPAERRPNRRKRALLAAIVTYADGEHSFDCTIRTGTTAPKPESNSKQFFRCPALPIRLSVSQNDCGFQKRLDNTAE